MSTKRTNLLASTAIVAALLAVPGLAQATELDTGLTITATDATGLADSDGAGAAIAVTINSNTGAITLGADGVAAINGNAAAADPVTVTVTTSGTANGVTFAGDVLGVNAGDTITINSTNDNLIFEGNVTSKGGAINMGSGAANPALSVTFDTANNENLTINAKVDAIDAGDTITMNVANSDDAHANTITFSQAVGGVAPIDTLNIGADTTATFSGALTAVDINVSSKYVTTLTGLVTGDIDFLADGKISNTGGIAGTVDNGTGANGAGTLTLASHTADVTGNIGATNSLKEVNATTTGGVVAFGGTVSATTITLVGTGATTAAGNIIGDVDLSGNSTLTVAADKGITGDLDNTSGGAAGIIVFGTSTANTTLVSGKVGATNAFTSLTATAGVDTTQSFGGAVQAETITLAGVGTTSFADDVTASTVFDFTADGTATFAANKKIVGDVDASGGSAGTLTFAATTTDTTLVSGTVGGSNALTAVNVAPATGKTATFADAYEVATTTHSGTGTVAFASTVAGDIDISKGGIVTAAGSVVGNVDNTGTAGTGTLTLAAGIDVTGDIGATKALAALNVTNTGGTVLTGAVKATAINLDGVATTAFTNGDVTGTVNFLADGTATVTGDEKIIGAVTTNVTETGTLTLAQTTVDGTELVSGAIGASGKVLKALNVSAAAATEASFGGDVYAKTITLTGAAATSEFTFDGDINATSLAFVTNGAVNIADGQNLTAAVTTGTTDRGILNFAGDTTVTGLVGVVAGNVLDEINVNGGVVTFANAIAATDINTAAAGTLKTTGAMTYKGAVNNSGALDLGGTFTATTGTIELGAAAGAGLLLAKETAYTGDVVIDGTAVDVDVTNKLTVTPHASFTTGALTLVNTNAGAGSSDDEALYAVVDNALASYAITVDGSSDVIITATEKAASQTAFELDVTSDAADAIQAGVAATVADDAITNAYNTAIQAGGIDAQIAADQSQQSNVTFAAQTLATIARSSAGAISDRLSAARTGTQVAGLTNSGVAAGSKGYRNGSWAKVFGGAIDQENREGYSGYDASTFGLAVGADSKVDKNFRLGLSGSYAMSDVDGKDFGNSETDIDAYQVAVYGSYEPGQYFVEGQLAYAFNQIDTERTINFGGLNRKAVGEYDANQFTATIGVGMPLKSNGYTFTPKAGLFYSYTDADSYTETGSGGMNLAVNPGDSSVLEGSLGSSVSYDHKVQGGILRPEARAALMYEFLDDDIATTSTYTGATTAFTTKGLKPAQFGGAVGLGVGYSTSDGIWDVRMDYDAEMREDYVGHSGMLTGRMHF